jgi:hypothetical protein
MKKIILSVIAAAISCCIAYAQPCLPEGITFTTQEEIDNFQANYPGCTEIDGSITFGGEDITNLNGLSVVTSIGGDLIICSYNGWGGSYYLLLTNLTGLDNLASIGGNLHIELDTALISLAGLESLTSIGGDLIIAHNYTLTNINGLENLASLGGSLIIEDNNVLTSLNGLENLTSIVDDIRIYSNPLTNLSGIGYVTSIGGYLYIIGNENLTSLNGLENLATIGGGITIWLNQALTSLGGLENLTSIGGGIFIQSNTALTSLTGLDNLTSIGEDINIGWNNTLASLSGLQNITSAGVVNISGNPSLASLFGLQGLTSIEVYLNIWNNDALTSLSGLDNLTSIEGGLEITDNNSLSTCEAEWLCSYLSNPSGSINIYGNAEGCSNPPEVADACGITPFCLPFGNYYFHSQADIDDFQYDYPDCTELEGNVTINGNNITNLNGLSVVTSIGDYLMIKGFSPLYTLTGLNNLTSIGGDLMIYNTSLMFLTGLDNLTSIGGGLYIGSEWVGGNPDLNNFTGLNNLTFILGDLYIGWNSSLTSLTGLDNVDAGSIANLTIMHNLSLSTCDVQSICEYLAVPNGTIAIIDNAPGCNSPVEVQVACAITTVEEFITGNGIAIIPNPSNYKITISSTSIIGSTTLTIFNVSGEKVMERQLNDNETQIDISALPRGVYFVRLQNEKMVEVGKMVKE